MDDDNDGFSDVDELAYGSDPLDSQSVINHAPEDILMEGGEIEENQPLATIVARFKGVDIDQNDSLSYRLIAPQQEDEYPFRLSQTGELISKKLFDYETDEHNYSLTVRVRDEHNTTYEKSFVVHLLNEVEDLDGDNIEDAYDDDRDGDGFSNVEEMEEGTNPDDMHSFPNKPILLTGEGVLLDDGSINLSGSVLRNGQGKINDFGFVLSSGISLDAEESTIYWVRGLGEPKEFILNVTQSPFDSTLYFRAWARNTAGYGVGSVKKIKIPEPPKPWWGIVDEHQGGWKTSDWFENFIYYEKGWLYHERLGWMYSSTAEEESVWLWKDNLGWLWTKGGVWPYLWSYNTGNWLYLVPSKLGEPVRFYDYSQELYR